MWDAAGAGQRRGGVNLTAPRLGLDYTQAIKCQAVEVGEGERWEVGRCALGVSLR